MRSWLVLLLGTLAGGLPVLAQSEGQRELYLEIRLESGAAAVVLHHTTPAGRYHILSKNSLAQEQWRVECELTGAAGSTATLIPLQDRPMLFLRAVEWQGSSTGAPPGGFDPAAPSPCPSAVDAMLVLDVSQSLSPAEFLRAREAASNFVNHLDLAVDRVGLISFAGGAVLEKPLTQDGRSVQTNILGLGIRSGTVLEPAIQLAQSQLAQSAPGTLRLMVVMSDGRMESPTLSNSNLAVQAAAAARGAGARMITIVYGTNGPGTNLMRILASAPPDAYHAPSAEELNARFGAMAGSLCRAGSGNRPPSVTLVTPTNAARFPAAGLAVVARAADSDGTIALLEVREGGHVIGSGAGTNLVFLWRPGRAGIFSLTARAVDNLGAAAVSPVATVTVAVNTGPLVNAGLDQSVTMAGTNPAVVWLSGNVSDADNLPADRSLQIGWSVVAGPGPVALEPDPADPEEPRRARATLRGPGAYTLRLQASDSLLGSADDVGIMVLKTNEPPRVYAGPDQTIILPDPVYLPGAVSDDGLPSGRVYVTWRGPGGVEFANRGVTNTFARFAQPGVYPLALTAIDGSPNSGGLWSTQRVTITVKAAREPRVVPDADELSVGVGGMRGFWNRYYPSDPEAILPLTSPRPGRAELRLDGVTLPVRRAFLYWHGPVDPADPSINAAVTVNGRRVTGLDLGGGADNLWSYQARTHRFHYGRAWRADLTAMVNTFGAGPYVLSNFVKGAEVEVNGASLVVFYEDEDPANNHDYVLVNGNDSNDTLLFNPQWADNRHPASINALAPAGPGVFIAGRFLSTTVPGLNGIARLRGDGALDSTFAPAAGVSPLGQIFESSPLHEVEAMAVQADGRVLLGGAFWSVEGQPRTNVARMLATGALDPEFDVTVDGPVHAIVLDQAGRILLGGGFTKINGQSRRGVARLSAAGVLDTFAPNVEGAVHAIGLPGNGQVIVAGEFSRVNGVNRGNIARLSTNGAVDVGFHPSVQGLVRAVLIRLNKTMVIGGDFWGVDEVPQQGVALLGTNGAVDLTFRPDLTGTGFDPVLTIETGLPRVHALAEHQGRILIGGRFVRVNGQVRQRIARLQEDGALDTGFDPGAGVDTATGQHEETPDVTVVRAFAVQPDGRVLIGGCFETLGGGAIVANGVARLNADGSLDPAFAPTDSGWNVSVPELNYSQGEVSLELHVSDGEPARVTDLDAHQLPIWSVYADAPVLVNGVPWLEMEPILSGNGRDDDLQIFAGVSVPGATWPLDQLAGLWDIVRRPLPPAVLRPGLSHLSVRAGNVPGIFPDQDAISVIAALASTPVGQTRTMAQPPVIPPSALTPIGWPDRFEVRRGIGRRVLDVLDNDISPGGRLLTLGSVSRPAHGTAEMVLQNSAILYTAQAGFAGEDSFTYTALDHDGNAATGSVTVQIVGTTAPTTLTPGVAASTNLSGVVWTKNLPRPEGEDEFLFPRVHRVEDGWFFQKDPNAWPELAAKSPFNDTNSTRGEGQFARFYTFNATAGDTVTLNLRTTNFLSHLYLFDPRGELIASANHTHYDVPAGTTDPNPVPFQLVHSNVLTHLILATGLYSVEVTSHARDETGPFTLQLEVDSPSIPKLELIVDGITVPNGGEADLGLQTPGTQKAITLRNAGRVDVPLVGSITVETFNGPRRLSGATLYPARLADLRAGASAALTLTLGELELAPNRVQITSPEFSASLKMEALPAGPQPPDSFFIETPAPGSRFFTPAVVPVVLRLDPNFMEFPADIELFARSAGRQIFLGRLTAAQPVDFGRYPFPWTDAPEGVHQLYARTVINGFMAVTAPVVIEVSRPAPNRPPAASNDVMTVNVNSRSNRLDLLANDRDSDDDPLHIITATAGAGTAITDGAAVFYTPPSGGASGIDHIIYRVSDGRGGVAQAVATVHVIHQPVRLNSPLDLSVYQTNTPVPLRALAASVVGALSRVEFFASGIKIAEAPGQTASTTYSATWRPARPGSYTVHAVAVESTGARLSSDPVRVRVVNEQNPSPDSPPVARIANVSKNQLVRSGFLEVRGTATDADDPLTYAVNVLRPADDTVLVSVAGAGAVVGDSLGTLDLTLLRNGAYILELVVTAGFGEARDRVPFVLESQLKIGQLAFSEQDLVIPVGSFPIAIVRTYDSINPAAGDFGPGWTLALNDVEMEIDEVRRWTRADEDNDDPDDLLLMRVGGGRNITLTLPDGLRTTFRYSEVTGPSDGGLPCYCYRAVWTPPPGIHATLVPMDLDTASFVPYQSVLPPYWDAALGTPLDNFDFRGFILTNAEGTRFDITRPLLGTVALPSDEDNIFVQDVNVRGPGKLTRITRRTGERLELRPDGIDHFYEGQTTRTASIHLARDPAHTNRLTAIYAPDALDAAGQPRPGALPVLRYGYYPDDDPAAGQLLNVERLSDPSRPSDTEITLYLYENSAQPRLLTATISTNPVTGHVRIVRHEFDADGRWIGSRDPAGNRTELRHVPGRGQSVITDAAGHSTLLEYDSRGNVTRTTDALGHAITRAYDEVDQLVSETDPLGHTTTYAYDDRGRRTRVIDPLGHTNTFAYDQTGQLLTAIDARGRGVTNAYDAAGQLTNSIDALGHRTSFTYDVRGQLTSQTDALGTITTNLYDDQGRLTYSATRNSKLETLNSMSFTYDILGNRLTESTLRTGPDGASKTVTTACAYDARNRLLATTNDAGGLNLVTSQTYNDLGQIETRTDAAGRVTRSFYDIRGNLVQTIQKGDDQTPSIVTCTVFDELNRPLYVQDRHDAPPNFDAQTSSTVANATHYLYDAVGRRVRTERLQAAMLVPACIDGACAMRFLGAGPELVVDGRDVRGEPFLSATTTDYDDAGRVRAVTDAHGSVTRYEYDDAGRRTNVIDALAQNTRTTYDANGNQTLFTDALGNSTTSVYDALNRRVELRFADNTVQRTVFDALGRRVAEIDPLGVTNRYAYDTLGRLTAVTNAWATSAATWTTYTHDEAGQVLTQTDALGRTTHFAYDILGHRVRRTLPGGQTESFVHDPATGRLLAHTNFNGLVITNLYDAHDRLLSRWHQDQLLEAFTYTPTGQRATTLDASGPTTFTYDAADRLATNATPQGELRYTYDLAGQLTGIQTSTPNGAAVRYTYDALNRLTNVAQVGQASSLSSYRYDAVGNLSTVAYNSGVEHRYRYDRLHRLTNLVVAAAALTLGQFDYRLDAAGQRTDLSESIQSVSLPTQRQYAWRYDPLHRLTNETISAGDVSNLGGAGNPGGAGNLPAPVGDSPTGSVSYAYDPVGNRLTRNSELETLNSQSLSYGPNDWLATDTYDANGNTATNGANVYQYDWANRLTNAIIGSKVISITYNAAGHRVKKEVSESGRMTITRYLVDDHNPTGYAQVLEELETRNPEPGTQLRVYTYGLDLISQTTTPQFQPSATAFFAYDGHGSTRLLLNEAGAVMETYTYDAYGTLLSATPQTPDAIPQTLYLYSGEQWDPDLRLYYNRARYLNTDTGSFWSMDVFEGDNRDPLSLHKYLYANANPINNADPSGEVSTTELMVTTAIIAINAGFLLHDYGKLQKASTLQDKAYYSTAVTIDALGLVSSFFGGGGVGPELRLAYATSRGAGGVITIASRAVAIRGGLSAAARIILGFASAMSGQQHSASSSGQSSNGSEQRQNSAGDDVTREFVDSQEELLKIAEEAAGGDLDKWKFIKGGPDSALWWESHDGKLRIEWAPDGHVFPPEGPHVTIREFNGRRHGVKRKIFLRGG